jgi:TolB-like protein
MKRIFTSVLLVLWLMLSVISLHSKTNSNADEIFKDLADTLSKVEKRLPNKTIAIYGFEVIGRPNDSYAKFATEKLTHYIVANGDLMVVERSRIDQILKEQSLSMTGAVDAGTAAKIGKILSVDAVIIGTIHATERDVEFIARVIQSEKGIILASANEKLVTDTYSGDDNGGIDQNDNEVIDNSKNSITIIKPSKTIFTRFEQVTISYSGLPGNQNDWITLTKTSEPDTTYGDWFYTYGQRSGTYSFKISEPGDYEVRVYYDWPNGGYIVQKRIKIKVK